ncbi:MAG: hypothetical protein J6L05_02065 [Ruminococcus sp.]|nr:hypothetical protein [Ruminococcus sp.]
MKKFLSAVLAGIMCTVSFTACGDKADDEKKDGGLSTKVDGEYVSIRPFNGKKEAFENGIDEGIKYSIVLVEDHEKDNNGEYNPYAIKFSDGEFLMPIDDLGNGWMYYDGTFSVKNGKIKFSYENRIFSGNGSKINIKDEVEYDADIARGTSEKLEGLSKEEKKELIEQELQKLHIQSAVEIMQKLNETGSYVNIVAPAMNFNDKFNSFSIFPYIRYVPLPKTNYDYPNMLYIIEDFLCGDTYGIELDGKYEKGKDFILKHDIEDVIRNDEQSSFFGLEDTDKSLQRNIEIARAQYDCDDVETTIEFSDGEWEWFNADGGLINNGKYDESKEYPGLIMMCLDEDSKNCPEYAIDTPLWLYIADDGEIYYPGYVKMN